MGYNYPYTQGHFYSIQAHGRMGYICPMDMTFKEALEHAMRVTGRGRSLRDVAKRAGVSYDILKNVNQSKSEKPNALAAAKVADFFGVSVTDFFAGRVDPMPDDEAADVAEDVATVTDLVRRLHQKAHRDQVRTFAKSLLQIEEAERQPE